MVQKLASSHMLACSFIILIRVKHRKHVKLLLLLLPKPFGGMGAWRKNMEHQKPGNSPRPGLEVANRQRVAKERAAQRVFSWTVQNEMRGVLGRVSACAARKILDSANPSEIRA